MFGLELLQLKIPKIPVSFCQKAELYLTYLLWWSLVYLDRKVDYIWIIAALILNNATNSLRWQHIYSTLQYVFHRWLHSKEWILKYTKKRITKDECALFYSIYNFMFLGKTTQKIYTYLRLVATEIHSSTHLLYTSICIIHCIA